MNRSYRNLFFLALLSLKLTWASESESEIEDDLMNLADFEDELPTENFSNYETEAGEGSSGNFYRTIPFHEGILSQDILSHMTTNTASTTIATATPLVASNKRNLYDKLKGNFFSEEPPQFGEGTPKMSYKKAKKPTLTRRNLNTVASIVMPEIPLINIALTAPVPRLNNAATDHSDSEGANTPQSITSDLSRTGSTYSGYDSTELLMRAPHGDSDLEPKGTSEYGSDSDNENRRKRRLVMNVEEEEINKL